VNWSVARSIGENRRSPATRTVAVLVAAVFGAALGCGGQPIAVPFVPKAPPPLERASRIVEEFFAAFNAEGDAALTAFEGARWSSRMPHPEDGVRVKHWVARRPVLGRLELRELTMEPDRVRTVACSASDGWVQVSFFFEAYEPHGVTGIAFRPAPSPARGECAGDAAPKDDAALAAAIDAYAQRYTSVADFAGVVLAQWGGVRRVLAAYGEADRDAHHPNTVDTRFNVGSVSKMFTATAIGQLTEAGKLRLEDRVRRWLPSFGPPQLDAATVLDLLAHRSGLGDFYGPKFLEMRQRLRTPQDYLDAFDGPLAFPPGSRFLYSNLGFVALGRIVERASGEDYDAYLDHHVFGPAAMTSTTNARYDVALPGRAVGYTHGPPGRPTKALTRNDAFNFPAGMPAGCTSATAEDLRRFMDALQHGELLAPAMVASMTAGREAIEVAEGVEDGAYALGFMDEQVAGMRGFGHGGGLPGANAYVEAFPARDAIIVVLANVDPPEATWLGARAAAWLARLPGATVGQ